MDQLIRLRGGFITGIKIWLQKNVNVSLDYDKCNSKTNV